MVLLLRTERISGLADIRADVRVVLRGELSRRVRAVALKYFVCISGEPAIKAIQAKTARAKTARAKTAFWYRLPGGAAGVTGTTVKLLPQYEADDGALAKAQVGQIKKSVPKAIGGKVRSSLFDVATETPILLANSA